MKIPTLDDLAKLAAAAHKIGSDLDKVVSDVENAKKNVPLRLHRLRNEAITSLKKLFESEK